jgi:hypothetical protein
LSLRVAIGGLRDASAITTAVLIGISGKKKQLSVCLRPDGRTTAAKPLAESARLAIGATRHFHSVQA